MLTYITSRGSKGEIDSDGCLEFAAGEIVSFDLQSGGHWFGHGFNHVQSCPLEQGSLAAPAFAVNNIQSPVWMCSEGVAILAETRRPLDVRLNENRDGFLRLSSAHETLRLKIWKRKTLPGAQAALLQSVGWPNRPPEKDLFGDCFFCTWTQYPRCINQERILDMAREIRARGYPCSTLIIDDRWESCFGELDFSRDFPDPAAMIRELHSLKFKVWMWVTPFVNQEASTFGELSENKILVPRRDGDGAALFKWWGGTAGLIDVTAPQGRKWLQEKLRSLMAGYGVDGFKIDGGDFKYQPSPEESAWHAFAGESGYSDVLLSLFEEVAPNQCETRTAWMSQSRSLVWRQGGKDSHWGLDNGLAAMVSLALHLGLMGYDLIIPDMIPGRVQTLKSDHPLPSDELMVRWTEATAFMPFMQFSYFPWNYAAGTEGVVRAYALLHKELEHYIMEQARDRKAPLIRPVWYDEPENKELFAVADEYMLGRDLLVAPVLASGVSSRNVLLPSGEWIDAWTGKALLGGLHPDHPAPCPGLPVFIRKGREDLAAIFRKAWPEISQSCISPARATAVHQAGLDRDISVTG